jgi:hypothetical protein
MGVYIQYIYIYSTDSLNYKHILVFAHVFCFDYIWNYTLYDIILNCTLCNKILNDHSAPAM